MEIGPTISPKQAQDLYFESLSAQGTKNYLSLVKCLVEELGMTISFTIDQKEASSLRALQNILEDDALVDFQASLFAKHGLAKDLEELEMDIHKSVAKLFAKYKDKTSLLPMRKNKEVN